MEQWRSESWLIDWGIGETFHLSYPTKTLSCSFIVPQGMEGKVRQKYACQVFVKYRGYACSSITFYVLDLINLDQHYIYIYIYIYNPIVFII